jgi:5-methylcytosine-specific restriction endonuclease McrBC GTP-binding regulatory subunit McrB
MNNPFKVSEDKLRTLLAGYETWLESDLKEAAYPGIFKEQGQKIREDFLNVGILEQMSDDDLYEKIFKYSRKLEGPVHMRLGQPRLRGDLPEIRRNLMYIVSTYESPFTVAQEILEGKYKIDVFAKAFWSPILQAQFPDVLPNWNNKTEKFLRKFDINISTSKLSISERYRTLSETFTFLRSLSEGHDFYTINHLMHYGTVIPEGIKLIEDITGKVEPDSLKSIIEKYKERIRTTELKDELYKWKLLKKYQSRPDVNAADFKDEITSIDYSNLVYPMAIAVRNFIAEESSEEYRAAFDGLFSDDKELNLRIQKFTKTIGDIYSKIGGEHGHHHDERTISTFLTYYNPDKYTFFKDSFYKQFCKALGIKAKPKGEKYAHYLELVADFVDQHIRPDEELISLITEFLNDDCFADENHLILAQDILYAMFEKTKDEPLPDEEITPGANPYFDLPGFKKYQTGFGQKYESQSDATRWYKETTNKLEYLVQLLKEELNENLAINYKERPSARAGRGKPFILKNYAITGFSPDGIYPEKGELFIKLAFHNLDKSPLFDIELDQNHQALEKPFQDIIDNLRETSRLSIPVDDNFPDNWDNLVDTIRPHVENLIQKYRQLTTDQGSEKKTDPMNIPLNTILYGPPGTGKTFHSISHAISIIDNEEIAEVLKRCENDRESVKKRYEELVENEQIVFCTFHQSMGYEDFIEGIKPVMDEEEGIENPQLTYSVKDGIFKKLCLEAAFSYVQKQATSETKRVLDFSEQYDQFVRKISESLDLGESPEINTISNQKLLIDNISQKNNLIVRHENGTRNYIASKQRLSQLAQAFPDLNTINNINDQFGAVIGGSNASAYWAVLNAIRKQSNSLDFYKKLPSQEKDYSPEEKMSAVETLKNENFKIENPKRYVLIIDEINRGNVSQIFGELITLIEDDKRLGKNEYLKVTLPYSGKKMGVPCNLYIVGTMNTADRSVEALDTALRRRFSFVHMKPEVEKLPLECDGINLQRLLETLNHRLRILKDEDHTIGHAWLINVNNLEQLKAVFGNKILPLLLEYFYNDYEKLGLVLGDAFFMTPHEKVGGNEFAEFSGSNGLSGQYNNMYLYKLKDHNELEKKDFLSLITPVPENEN